MPVSRSIKPSNPLRIHRLRGAVRRISHSLVRVGNPLRHSCARTLARDVLAARAAARAKSPEQAADERADECEPHVRQHSRANSHGDAQVAKILPGIVDHLRVCQGSHDSEGEDEARSEERRKRCEERAQTREEPADADEDLDAGGDDGEDKKRRHPLAVRGQVGIVDELLEVLAEHLVLVGGCDAPDLRRVETVLQRARRAEVDGRGALLAEGELAA